MATTIRDPVHGGIRLDDWAVPLVDHAVMQRLRHVQQLGTANLVYPGANHRRFEHSLGAYHLAGRLAEALGLDDSESLTVRAGALLHDVGHGPFSHAFEEVMAAEGHKHESTTVDLVRWGPLGDLLRQGGIDPVAVSELVVGQGPLAKLVSGAIDADRMDYLLRDAHYTGVRSSVDPDRLLRVLQRDGEEILLRESGILSAESLLTMRFLMYPAVYLHHTVRASERILQAAIHTAVQEGHFSLQDVALDTDDALLHRLRSAGGVPAELIDRLDKRRLYKRAIEFRPEQADDIAYLGDPGARMEQERIIAEAAGVAPHEVLLDVPHAPRFRELDLQVLRRDGSVVPLREASQLVQVLEAARMDHWRAWVFCPERHRDAVHANVKLG